MKERPIVMTAESVRAILDGRKTQTRRVVRPQPEFVWGYGIKLDDQDHFSAHVRYPGARVEQPDPWIRCPYGIPGDRLWVRETWAYIGKEPETDTVYKADGCWSDKPDWKWRSPIFMPRWASRLTLEILNIRVERVREISERDAYMEGIDRSPTMPHPIAWYRDLWNSINAKRGYPWADNPFVWAIDFKVLP